MGLFRAVTAAAGGVAKDTWKEFFTCNSLPEDTMMVKGERLTHNSNNMGDSNVITDGSICAVADGQAAIVVCQGKVVNVFMEPGEHTYESKYSKSVFSKGGVAASVKEAGRRISFGGDVPAVDERIYYMNTKIISGGKFGPVRIPFGFEDKNTGLSLDTIVGCTGSYTFRVVDPMRFYKLVAGNVSGSYKTYEILRMMDNEFTSVMLDAFGRTSNLVKRSYELPNLIPELQAIFKKELTDKWKELRGIELVTMAFTNFNVEGSNRETIAELQRAKVLSDSSMGAGFIAAATGDAMHAASENTGGNAVVVGAVAGVNGSPIPFDNGPIEWTCKCGQRNKGKFCIECGSPRQ